MRASREGGDCERRLIHAADHRQRRGRLVLAVDGEDDGPGRVGRARGRGDVRGEGERLTDGRGVGRRVQRGRGRDGIGDGRGQHHSVSAVGGIADREGDPVDPHQGALGPIIERPDDRGGALDDRERLPARRSEAERGNQLAPAEVNRAGHVELAVAGARGRAVERDVERRGDIECDIPLGAEDAGPIISRAHDRSVRREAPDRPGAGQGPGEAIEGQHAAGQRAVHLQLAPGDDRGPGIGAVPGRKNHRRAVLDLQPAGAAEGRAGIEREWAVCEVEDGPGPETIRGAGADPAVRECARAGPRDVDGPAVDIHRHLEIECARDLAVIVEYADAAESYGDRVTL